jgi:hypothetical protein
VTFAFGGQTQTIVRSCTGVHQVDFARNYMVFCVIGIAWLASRYHSPRCPGATWAQSGVAMNEIKLTKRIVDILRPRSKEYVVWDSQLIGFGLRVRPTGTKSFVAIYRAGKGRNAAQRKITIGPSGGTLTPDMARKAARVILGAAASGGDPAKRAALQKSRALSRLIGAELSVT